MKKPLFSAIALFLCYCLSACSLLQVETGESSSGEEECTGTVTAGISDTIRGENLMFASKNAGDGLIRQLIHGCSTVSTDEKGVYSYN